MKIISLKKQKYEYLTLSQSDKAFRGRVVNRPSLSYLGVSLEITLTIPFCAAQLIIFFILSSLIKNVNFFT